MLDFIWASQLPDIFPWTARIAIASSLLSKAAFVPQEISSGHFVSTFNTENTMFVIMPCKITVPTLMDR